MARLWKCVLRRGLNEEIGFALLSFSDRLLKSLRALMANSLSPLFFSLDSGTIRKAVFEDLRACDSTREVKRSRI